MWFNAIIHVEPYHNLKNVIGDVEPTRISVWWRIARYSTAISIAWLSSARVVICRIKFL